MHIAHHRASRRPSPGARTLEPHALTVDERQFQPVFLRARTGEPIVRIEFHRRNGAARLADVEARARDES